MPPPVYTAVPADEIEVENDDQPRPKDVGTDALPFEHLSGRRFEVLSFLLKKATAPDGDIVTLVKSSKDRGRDVTVYRDGQLIEIVQCKNQDEAMSAPDVMREVLKIALHSCIDPSLIPHSGTVTLSMWCTSGFTEQADGVIESWPQEWRDPSLTERFEEVRQKYVAFRNLEWTVVENKVRAFAGRSPDPC